MKKIVFALVTAFSAASLLLPLPAESAGEPQYEYTIINNEATITGFKGEPVYIDIPADEQGRINFVGNIEGTGVFDGAADVVVTDGFTGNVLLKGTEGVIKYMMKSLKGVFYKSTKNKLAAAVLKSDLSEMKKSMDVNEVGGTAFVGISKPVIKAHGSSNAASFFAAIRQAKAFVEANVVEDIKANIDYMRIRNESEANA